MAAALRSGRARRAPPALRPEAPITRAGGLSFEAVREDLEPALAEFVGRAGRGGIADLETITASVPPMHQGDYALVGATVVDGTDRPPIRDAVIVIRNRHIAAVGPRAAVLGHAAGTDEGMLRDVRVPESGPDRCANRRCAPARP